jgi:hypothetical protein
MALARWQETAVATLHPIKRFLPVLLAGLAALYAFTVTWRQNEHGAGLDWYIYFVNAQLASRDDIENIYSQETQERVGEEYFERGSGARRSCGNTIRCVGVGLTTSPALRSTLWSARVASA